MTAIRYGMHPVFDSFPLDTTRLSTFKRGSTRANSLEKTISSLGIAASSVITDGSSAGRSTVTTLPIKGWSASSIYPDMPNSPHLQELGMTTALHSYLGMYGMYRAVQTGRN